ncbi:MULTISPECIES: hypothetical protein [unclassified Streptomyces]|nr:MULTISPECIES: hypothetical protein [unclassified Streptomyces]
MRHALMAAPGGGPDLLVWGQVLFVVVAILIGVFVVRGLLGKRHK